MPKLHRTVGIYPDGSYKVNTVTASHLPIHVDYNKTWRWGRALLVDDELVYAGLGVSDDRIAEVRFSPVTWTAHPTVDLNLS